MSRGLGEEIAVLEGLNLQGLAAAVPKKEKLLVSTPTPAPQRHVNSILSEEAEFLAYMSETPNLYQSGGTTFTGGSSYSPGLPLRPSGIAGLAGAPTKRVIMPINPDFSPSDGANYGGGGAYYPGGSLGPSNAGLASDMAALDGNARTQRSLNRSVPNGHVREALISSASQEFGGGTYGGGGAYYPGARLMPGGLAAAPSRTTTADGAVQDSAFRGAFDTAATHRYFVGVAGVAVLKSAEKSLAETRSWTPGARNDEVAKRIAKVTKIQSFRKRIASYATGGRKLTSPVVKGLWAREPDGTQQGQDAFTRESEYYARVSAPRSGVEGLGALEGRIGRKIRKGLKKGLKAGAKFAVKTAFTMGPAAMGIPIPLPVPKKLR